MNEKQLVPDAGGDGRYRGGCGQRFSMTSFSEHPMSFAMRGDRIDHPPQGLFGGRPGGPGVASVNGKRIHSKRTIVLKPGDTLVLQTPGGGGYGDPSERAEAARREDRENEYVTA